MYRLSAAIPSRTNTAPMRTISFLIL
jgi:hypothetical protein